MLIKQLETFPKTVPVHSYILLSRKTRKDIKKGGFIIMRKMKRLLAAGLATIMACSMLTGCGGGSSDKKASSDKDSSKGSVYYLNFKPEADEQWQELAKNTQTKLVFQLQ